MRNLLLGLLLMVGCAGSKPLVAPPGGTSNVGTGGDEGSTAPAPAQCGVVASQPMTPDQCTCSGGKEIADPGDGSAMCDPSMTKLGMVAAPDHNGVCCKTP